MLITLYSSLLTVTGLRLSYIRIVGPFKFDNAFCVLQIGENYHWIGGRCVKNSTGSHYFWETAEGEIPFDLTSVPTKGRMGGVNSCDTNRDGIQLRSSMFDDISENSLIPFLCEMSSSWEISYRNHGTKKTEKMFSIVSYSSNEKKKTSKSMTIWKLCARFS